MAVGGQDFAGYRFEVVGPGVERLIDDEHLGAMEQTRHVSLEPGEVRFIAAQNR